MTATFSDLYLQPSALLDDSKRMRVQLAALYLRSVKADERLAVREYLKLHSGIVARSGQSGAPLDLHFSEGELSDVLDSITAIADWFREQEIGEIALLWLGEVRNIFNKQHVKYTVDEQGTVRLRVDAAFEADREAVISGLSLNRYGGVRSEFERAYSALSATQPDGKAAIRGIFEACEVTFKLMFPVARRIGAPEIATNLMSFVEQHYASDPPALEATKKLVQAFNAWVASAQFYRHGQGQEEPNQPPLEIAVAILSEGASHLRWLIYLDQAKLEA